VAAISEQRSGQVAVTQDHRSQPAPRGLSIRLSGQVFGWEVAWNTSLYAGTRVLGKPHCCEAFRACSKTRYSEFSRLRSEQVTVSIESMERETGLEPATSSLGRRL